MQQYLNILNKAIKEWTTESRPASRLMSAEKLSQLVDFSLDEKGASIEQLEQAAKDFLYYNPDVASKDFCKLLYSGQNKPALLGDWITAISNATMHTYQVAPVATLMEVELIKQWNKLIGFHNPEIGLQGDGIMVPGASQANLLGMMLARHKSCAEYKAKGSQGKVLVAYVSEQAHYSWEKAANVLGIGTDNLVAIKADDQGRLCPESLEVEIQNSLQQGHIPFFIGVTAGTTVVGSFDPVKPCAEIAAKYQLWLHIDGAWGAPVVFSDKHKHLLENSELADSMAWDAHKFMNVPLTAAVILVKKTGLLEACCSGGGGEYLFHADENAQYNLGQKSIQCGRRADALKVWLSWKALGHLGFAEKMDRQQKLKSYCVDQIEGSEHLQMLAPAVYLNVLFRFEPTSGATLDEQQLRQLNIDICKQLQQQGDSYVDYARYKGHSGIRLILANEQKQNYDIDRLLDNIVEIGKGLLVG
ncbi:pyridoxal phosphate-dependent decarboxylase family protein [Pelagibaculum spongiae]|uniref:Glutamate decarboxylase n=1 Tax=Pelagibaculum spongiae TaxID=2080658 RepID=A0A2V1H759_9GAMM|nr:aminotransferase class V-fold PLP-dependent enzyme [Pelagibaculum spongiae]PVZ72282.1 glutamate decarboxylase [Pelagibaculum spongiae]